jgi:hypothetical protein
MSWNNVIPAWALFPVRVLGTYSDGSKIGKGFMTKQDAEQWVAEQGDNVSFASILEDDE